MSNEGTARLASCPHTTNPTAVNRSPVPPKMSMSMNGGSTDAPVASSSTLPNGKTQSNGTATYGISQHATTSQSGSQVLSSIPFDLDQAHRQLRSSSTFILGTRKSQLALVQTHMVADSLAALHTSSKFTVEWMTTLGDRNQQTPLHLLTPYSQQQPAKSLWTDELEARLMDGHFDLLVHSLKDVPTTLKEGCEIACMLKREDPADALVVRKGLEYKSLDDLPDGSIVGTGSVRRVAQLKRAYPLLKFEDMRGNLNTRLAKLDAPDSKFVALILAISGLSRIDAADRVTCAITSPALFHAVGQGALGVEIRTGDGRVRETMRGVGHWQTEWRCAAERGCLRVLEGGCSVPVGVETELEELDFADPSGENGAGEDFTGETFDALEPDSPMLWFSGIVDSSHRLPSSLPSTPGIATPPNEPNFFPLNRTLPPLRKRMARLKLRTCVTSLDGSSQVVHDPPAVIVRNYQQAERFGEMCAREVKRLGGKEILDEVGRIRRERERKDLERAIERSRQDTGAKRKREVDQAEGEKATHSRQGSGDEQQHEGLQVLLKSLNEESEEKKQKQG